MTSTRTPKPPSRTFHILGAAASLAFALVANACAEAAAADPPVVEVTAYESDGTYSFDLPEEVEFGPTRIHFVNHGAEPHHVQLFKLNDRVTIEEVAAALETADPATVLELGTFEGGTGLVAPGQESQVEAVVELTPGTYAVICFVPGPDGMPHFAHGMIRPLEVTEAIGSGTKPQPTHRVELLDYGFDLPEELPGDALLEVTNNAAMEPHEMIVARLDEGASTEHVLEAIQEGDPVPALPLGGVQAILPGRSQHLQLDLAPGAYVIWCQIPSPDGIPHVAKGMIRTVTVR